jgi:hypothetical protein
MLPTLTPRPFKIAICRLNIDYCLVFCYYAIFAVLITPPDPKAMTPLDKPRPESFSQSRTHAARLAAWLEIAERRATWPMLEARRLHDEMASAKKKQRNEVDRDPRLNCPVTKMNPIGA